MCSCVERVLFPVVPAIGAVAGSVPLDAYAQCHLEVCKTFLRRAFPAKIALFVSVQLDVDLVAVVSEIVSYVSTAFRVLPDARL